MGYKKTPSIKHTTKGKYPKSRNQIIREATPIEGGRYLMGTKADHTLGDISRDDEDLFNAYKETDEFYVGSWVTGFGFFDVTFPKETSRELTKEEIEKYSKTYVQIGSQPPIKINL